MEEHGLVVKMKKVLLTLILGLFLISSVPAIEQSLGNFKLGKDVNLIQTCATCTFNNISSVLYPNSSESISEFSMTKIGTIYNFTLNSNSVPVIGTYIVNGFGDLDGVNTIWSYTFIVTSTGFELTQQRAIVFMGLLFILVFLFIVNMLGIAMLPSRDSTNEMGELISISNLKHLRSILFVVGYLLLMSIVFLSSNVALAYLGTTLFGNILFVIFQIMLGLALPLFVIWLMYVFSRIFQDKKVKRMIERGIPMGDI